MSGSGWFIAIVLDVDDDVEEVHILPEGDIVAHEYSEDCVCGPAPSLRDSGGWLYTHESLDRREDDE